MTGYGLDLEVMSSHLCNLIRLIFLPILEVRKLRFKVLSSFLKVTDQQVVIPGFKMRGEK